MSWSRFRSKTSWCCRPHESKCGFPATAFRRCLEGAADAAGLIWLLISTRLHQNGGFWDWLTHMLLLLHIHGAPNAWPRYFISKAALDTWLPSGPADTKGACANPGERRHSTGWPPASNSNARPRRGRTDLHLFATTRHNLNSG